MGWKFWKSEQTDAERSLAALQAQAAAPAAPAASAAPGTTPLQDEADAHMTSVVGQLEALIGASTPPEEQGSFMLEVTTIRTADDGTLVLGGGAHEGSVSAGMVVGLMVLGEDVSESDPHLTPGEDDRRQAEALLAVRARSATVVAWAADPPVLVVSGLAREEVTVGSMVTR